MAGKSQVQGSGGHFLRARGSWLYPMNTQETESKEFMLASAQFIFPISYRLGFHAQGVVPIISHSHAQMPISQVILDSAKLKTLEGFTLPCSDVLKC